MHTTSESSSQEIRLLRGLAVGLLLGRLESELRWIEGDQIVDAPTALLHGVRIGMPGDPIDDGRDGDVLSRQLRQLDTDILCHVRASA